MAPSLFSTAEQMIQDRSGPRRVDARPTHAVPGNNPELELDLRSGASSGSISCPNPIVPDAVASF